MIDPEKYWKNYDISQNPTNPLINKPVSNVVSICSHFAYRIVRSELVGKDSSTNAAEKLHDTRESTDEVRLKSVTCVCLIDGKVEE